MHEHERKPEITFKRLSLKRPVSFGAIQSWPVYLVLRYTQLIKAHTCGSLGSPMWAAMLPGLCVLGLLAAASNGAVVDYNFKAKLNLTAAALDKLPQEERYRAGSVNNFILSNHSQVALSTQSNPGQRNTSWCEEIASVYSGRMRTLGGGGMSCISSATGWRLRVRTCACACHSPRPGQRTSTLRRRCRTTRAHRCRATPGSTSTASGILSPRGALLNLPV